MGHRRALGNLAIGIHPFVPSQAIGVHPLRCDLVDPYPPLGPPAL